MLIQDRLQKIKEERARRYGEVANTETGSFNDRIEKIREERQMRLETVAQAEFAPQPAEVKKKEPVDKNVSWWGKTKAFLQKHPDPIQYAKEAVGGAVVDYAKKRGNEIVSGAKKFASQPLVLDTSKYQPMTSEEIAAQHTPEAEKARGEALLNASMIGGVANLPTKGASLLKKLATESPLLQEGGAIQAKGLNKTVEAGGEKIIQSEVADSFLPQPQISKTISKGTPVSPPTPQNPRVNPSWVNKVGTSIRETVQDNWVRVKNLVEEGKVDLNSKELNPYQAETLMHGRIQARHDSLHKVVADIDKETAGLEKSLKDPGFKKKVDLYLISKHAPERNALHGDGAAGMTNAEAATIQKKLSGNKEIQAVAEKVKGLSDQTLEVLHESQVISDKTYNTLRASYKEHVPLQRLLDNTDADEYLLGKGLDVKSSGIIRAKGSKREVADILTNVTANLEQAIVRAEKNRVNLATLEFARGHKELGLFEEIRPRAIGKTFDGKPIIEKVNDPLVLTVREKGKPVYLKIKDQAIADAFKAVNKEEMPRLFKFIGEFTRLYSQLNTRFNLEFAFSNKLRDLQEMAVYMASQKDIGFSGAIKTVGRDMGSTFVDVTAGVLGKNTEGARLYRQMVNDGGTTGGMALSTRKQLEINLDDIRKMNRGGVLNARNAGKKFLGAIDSWNEVFENSTRLSVYKTALDKGMNRNQAAFLAKNSTINFNKKGTGGAIINSLYMFSNASIQGTTKLLVAMKNPKVAASVIGSVGTAVWTAGAWNDSVDPDWRDKVSKWDRESNLVVALPSKNGGIKYMTVPVSWGLKPINVMASYAYDASHGKAGEATILNVAGKVLGSIWNAYNPVGGSSLGAALMPTIGDVPLELRTNQTWSGGMIRPGKKVGVPESESFFQNKEGVPSDKSKTFGLLRSGSKALSQTGIEVSPAVLKYALDQYLGGTGRSISGFVESVRSIGESELQTKDTPFLRRFLKEKFPEEVEKARSYAEKDALTKKLQNTPRGEQPEVIQEYISSLPEDKRKGVLFYQFNQEGFNVEGVSTSEDIIRMKPTFKKVQELMASGDSEGAKKILRSLSKDDLEGFKKVRSAYLAKKTKSEKEEMQPIFEQIRDLVRSGKKDEATSILKGMTERQREVFKLVKDSQ